MAGTAASRITRKATTKTSPVSPLTGIRLVITGSYSPPPIIADRTTGSQIHSCRRRQNIMRIRILRKKGEEEPGL